MKNAATLIDRLRKTMTQCFGAYGENDICVSDLQLEAADEIERLRGVVYEAACVAKVAGLTHHAKALEKKITGAA
jgi:hypothetical protein